MAQMVKESACNAEDPDVNPGTQKSISGYPLQYSCLENSTDGGPGGLRSIGPPKGRQLVQQE